MTFEVFLEEWNAKFYKEFGKWLEKMGYAPTPRLQEKIIAETLNYAIVYADYFKIADPSKNDEEILKFLKAICLRVVFFSDDLPDGKVADAIEDAQGALWKRCVSQLSINHRRVARLMLKTDEEEKKAKEDDRFTNILREFEWLEDEIEALFFGEMRAKIDSLRNHAATAMRYKIEGALIESRIDK